MKNMHKMVIVLISLMFAVSGAFAQSDVSPKLENQLEDQVKPPKVTQEMQQMQARDMAPTPEQQLQQRLEADGIYELPVKGEGNSGPADDLCAPQYTTGCTVGDGFTDFAVEEIQNLGSGCADLNGVGWSQYFGLGPATLVPGFIHTFTMGTGYSNQYVNIYIDFNDDDVLDPDEAIITDYVMVAAGVLYDVDITIPANATPGLHKMRAMAVWLNPFTDPCGSYSYGEAEDYMVNVITPDYGDLEGFVTENTGGAAIEGATVEVNGGMYTTTTAADGSYSFDDVLVGDWPIAAFKDGYNPNTGGTVSITVGTLTQYDLAMTTPTMDITPTSISITIDPFAQQTEVIDIANNGDGPLDWSASLELLTDNGEDMWDVLLDVPVGVGGGEAGIETDGSHIYTTKWNGAEFYRYELDGTFIESFTCGAASNIRDMAFNGTYFYGGAASPTVYEMDFTSQTVMSTFTAPTDCRAIAYHDGDNAFFANNWGSNITKFDMAGANLGSFPVGPVGDSYYGFAYDNYSAGGEFLWGYAQVGATSNELVQMELPSGVETGVYFDVGSVANVGAGIAGGLAIADNLVPGLWAVLGTSQNENIWALELYPAGPVWLAIDPSSGSVDPGNVGMMDVNFDATDIVAGTVKTANIHFSSNPDVGMVTVPVSMTVGNLAFGFVEGNVFLDGVLPYNIGDVTEVLVTVGPYSGFPDVNGDYSIETYPGTYDVTAMLYGYETQVTSGVVVGEGVTVTVDFTMPCTIGEVAGTVTAEDGGAPIEGAEVEILDTEFMTTTAADGTYSILIDQGTYDVKVTAPFYAMQMANVVIGPQATTTQDFVMPTLEGIIVVIDLDPTPNPQIVDVIQGFFPGGLVEYTTNINGYVLDEQVQTVFLLLGIFANNYTLTDADAAVITAWIDGYDDRNLYMEGGDTWAYDAPTALHGYFNINPIADGSGDLANVEGIDSFWSGFSWGYFGENNWIDNIEAIAPAINVLQNPDVGYFCGVAYDEGTYKTVGTSFEVTGLDDGTTGFLTGVQTVMGFFGYPVFLYGDLEGHVFESDGTTPIEDALVSLGGLGEDMTDASGYYLIEGVLIGDWTVTCTKDGYNPETADVTIEEGITTVQDFVLTAPEFNVTPTSIAITLDPNATGQEFVDINNPGSGVVNWSANLNISGDSGEDMFDLLLDVPVGVGGGEAGIETDGQFIYTTKWNGADFYRYAMDGTYIETFSCGTASNVRDMAYDGTYFYGGAASPTVFEMDFNSQTVMSTFTAPTDCRAIAYNEVDDAFYANNWGSDITKFDMAGGNLGSFPVGPVGDSYYGFAFDNYSGGTYLWGHAQVGATSNELIQIELPSGVETGLYFDVGSVANVGAGIAGGLAIDDQIVSGLWAFLGTSQNENIWALELGESQTWIAISPTNGTLDPGGSDQMTVDFDATGLLPGFYYADINFSTTPNVGSPTVTVELEVEGLIPAINLVALYNCTDVELTWEMPAGGTPDSWNVYRDGTLLGNAPDMMYTDPMVDPEVEYAYTVTAVYGTEESFPTPEFLITVPIPDDLEPLGTDAVDQGNGTVLFTWEAPDACLAPDEYDVYRDGEYIATTTDLEYTDTGLEGGFYEYYVVAVYYFGESGQSSPAYVLVIVVGMDEFATSEFQIFPNPASDVVNVKSDFHVNTIQVMNNAGQVVYTARVESNQFNVNVSQFDRGIYYIKMVTDEGTALRKFAVK